MLLDRAAARDGLPDDVRTALEARGRRAAGHRPRAPRAARGRARRAGRRRAGRPPAARAADRLAGVPAGGPAPARAGRLLVRDVPPLGGRDVRRGQPARGARGRCAPPPPGCRRSPQMGFDVVYLTPVHPIGTTYRKGRNNSLTPRRGRPRLALRDRLARGRPRRHPPRAGHVRRLRRVRRPGPRAGHGGRPRPRPAVLAGPPLGHRAPGVVHHPAGRHDRLRREPAEEVPGHLPAELRQRPRRDLRRGAAGAPGLDRPRASRRSGWTTRTPSRWSSGSG